MAQTTNNICTRPSHLQHPESCMELPFLRLRWEEVSLISGVRSVTVRCCWGWRGARREWEDACWVRGDARLGGSTLAAGGTGAGGRGMLVGGACLEWRLHYTHIL